MNKSIAMALFVLAFISGCAMGDQQKTGPEPPVFADNDGDGYNNQVDCDDFNAAVNPGMAENCTNLIDDNCNKQIDGEDVACQTQCDPSLKDIPCDCDATHVGGTKDCSPQGKWLACEDCKSTDADGDGYKSKDLGGDDCKDTDATIHPGAVENCTDGKDNDCNGDTDGADVACHSECTPGTTGVKCDCDATHVDGTKDCSPQGKWLTCQQCKNTDVDGDGHKNKAYGGDDCDDNNASIHPGATDICGDGINQDCSSDGDAVCTGCTPGATQSGCLCSNGGTNGTQTCQSDRTWGICTCAPECTTGATNTCNNNCPSGKGTQSCVDGRWGSCTCTPSGPVACANLPNIQKWCSVTLQYKRSASFSTSNVKFEGTCGLYDASSNTYNPGSEWTGIPSCENVSPSDDTFTCSTRVPDGFTFVSNVNLLTGLWAIGVLTDGQANCSSGYKGNTCSDLWEAFVLRGDYDTAGNVRCNSSNAVFNNKDSSLADGFNCRIVVHC
jgi:hypothetical protein